MREWTFLTNHATALLCVARSPGMTLRQIGDHVGITERAAHRIISDLVDEGYLTRSREGRRNRYEVRLDAPLRDPLLHERTVGDLLSALPVDIRSTPNGAGVLGTRAEATAPALAAKPTAGG